MADPFSAALIFSSLIMAGGTIAATQLADQPDIETPEMPDFEAEASAAAKEEKRRVSASRSRLAEREATLGPIQLQAAGLGV